MILLPSRVRNRSRRARLSVEELEPRNLLSTVPPYASTPTLADSAFSSPAFSPSDADDPMGLDLLLRIERENALRAQRAGAMAVAQFSQGANQLSIAGQASASGSASFTTPASGSIGPTTRKPAGGDAQDQLLAQILNNKDLSPLMNGVLTSASPSVRLLNANTGGGPSGRIRPLSGGSQPVANNDSYSLLHDSTLSVPVAGVLANDTGSNLSAVLVATPSHGTLTLQSNGSFVYISAASYVGSDSFTYYATNGTQNSNTATVSLTITDNAPVAASDSYTILHDQTLNVAAAAGLLANDSDADGDALKAILVAGTGPSHGSLTLNADGSFTYVPNAHYVGPDSFQYKASDGALSSAATTVNLTVTDTAAVAHNDSYGVQPNKTLNVSAAAGVLANDSDADGDHLTATVTSGPTHGSLTLNTDGSFSYTPTTNYTGPDSFQYTASDGALGATATVSLTVHATNAAPVANPDNYSVLHDQSLTVGGIGVLANDTDANGDPLTASLVSGSGPIHGTLTLNANGSLMYTAAAHYVGSDSFQYVANDGLVNSSPTTVSLTVTDPNAPVAVADSYTIGHDKTLNVNGSGVLLNDSDADGDALTANLVTGSGPSHGTLTLNASGSFIYTPASGYIGSDSFQYTASDGVQISSPGTVSITVTDSAPITANAAFNVLHDTTLSVPALGVLAYDYDPDGEPMTAAVVTTTQHGTLTLQANGSFTYVPNAGYTGPDSFTYTASDATLTSAAATVNLTIKASDTAPTAAADSYNLAHDITLSTSATSGVLANDTDSDGDPLMAKLVASTSHGALTLNLDGSFVYTPTAAYSGPDSFTYQAFDGTANSATTTVSLTITNDVPVAVTDSYSVLASGMTSVSAAKGVLANDTDLDDALQAIQVSGPAHGTLVLNSDGSFNYSPGTGFTGTDSFTYKAFDGSQYSSPVTVMLTTSPVAVNDFYSINHDRTRTVAAATGVLANDTLATGGPLTVTLVGGSGPAHGTLTINSDGSFTYTPTAGYIGSDSFSYFATGGAQNSNTATVTLTVVDTAPVTGPESYNVNENQSLSVPVSSGVLANDYDLEGDALKVQLATGPANGTLALSANGNFTYTPNSNFFGTDTFTYQDSDGLLTSAPVTVTITVNQILPMGSSPRAVAVGDFNGDGNLDVAMADQSLNQVIISFGSATGALSTGSVPPIPVGITPVALAVADFNGDGKADLAVVNSVSNTVSILLGNGNGTFQAPITLNVGAAPKAIAVGDFNGDGKIDLAVANSASNTVSILLGNGNGTFQAPIPLNVGNSPLAIAAGDFNGDGKTDLAVANGGSSSVSILLGIGNGTFQAGPVLAVGANPVSIAVADLNADGFQDLAVANSASNTVSILFGNGNGSFTPAATLPVGANPQSVAVGDVNHDGLPDLIVANHDSNTVWTFVNAGGAQFFNPTSFAAVSPYSVAIGDFNKDGFADIIVAVAAGEEKKDGKPDISPANAVAFNQKDSSFVVWVTTDGLPLKYDLAKKSDIAFTGGNAKILTAISLSPDGQTLVAAGSIITLGFKFAATLSIWNTKTPAKPTDSVTMTDNAGNAVETSVNAMAFSPDDKNFATAHPSGNVYMWNAAAATHQDAIKVGKEKDAIVALAFNPKSPDILAIGDQTSQTIYFWDISAPKDNLQFQIKVGQAFNALAISPDGKKLAVANPDKTIVVYDISLGKPDFFKELTTIKTTSVVTALTFSADGGTVFTGNDKGVVELYPTAGGKPDNKNDAQAKSITGVSVSGDGKMFAATSADGTMAVYDAKTLKLVAGPVKGPSK